MNIETETIGEAWREAVACVINEGKKIEDDGEKLKEVLDLSLTIIKPFKNDTIVREHGDSDMISWMEKNFLSCEKIKEWGYSYGQRIFDYEGIDQFALAAEKLKRKPDAKSATISLMHSPQDGNHMPCICTIDFKLRDKKLHLFAFFRSQDIFKKSYADAAALSTLLSRMAKELDVKKGRLHLKIASAHIYELDFKKAEKFASEL